MLLNNQEIMRIWSITTAAPSRNNNRHFLKDRLLLNLALEHSQPFSILRLNECWSSLNKNHLTQNFSNPGKENFMFTDIIEYQLSHYMRFWIYIKGMEYSDMTFFQNWDKVQKNQPNMFYSFHFVSYSDTLIIFIHIFD